MKSFLRGTKLKIDKQRGAIKESFPLHEYFDPGSLFVETYPFPHVVVDNFFKDRVYQKLSCHFQRVLRRGFSRKENLKRFEPFLNLKGKYAYDGYVYVPWYGEDQALDVFFSVEWNNFFSNIFKQITSWSTSMAYHHHPSGNRTGFVHHDHAEKEFTHNNELPNGVIFQEGHKTSRFSALDVDVFKEYRSIALIYYLGGTKEWKKGDGGETGLYVREGDSPVKLVAPINNRLLAFKISPHSFHAFQENHTPRSSIVQWFHSPKWIS